jgi:hypothetical protein
MDYDKTVQLYEKAGLIKKWLETPEANLHKWEKVWYEKVTSKRTGQFWQVEDLIRRNLVPDDYESPYTDMNDKPIKVKFPVKCTKAIYRIRLKDNTEWIKTKQEWWGLSEAGSLVNQTMNDKECYDAILPLYKLKPENPRERDSRMIREVADIGHKIKYTVPFKPETVQKLFDTRDGDCGLVIMDEAGIGDKPPYSIPSLHQFMNTPFEELISWASTPQYKLDRSYKDQLEASHIG